MSIIFVVHASRRNETNTIYLPFVTILFHHTKKNKKNNNNNNNNNNQQSTTIIMHREKKGEKSFESFTPDEVLDTFSKAFDDRFVGPFFSTGRFGPLLWDCMIRGLQEPRTDNHPVN